MIHLSGDTLPLLFFACLLISSPLREFFLKYRDYETLVERKDLEREKPRMEMTPSGTQREDTR